MITIRKTTRKYSGKIVPHQIKHDNVPHFGLLVRLPSTAPREDDNEDDTDCLVSLSVSSAPYAEADCSTSFVPSMPHTTVPSHNGLLRTIKNVLHVCDRDKQPYDAVPARTSCTWRRGGRGAQKRQFHGSVVFHANEEDKSCRKRMSGRGDSWG
ncbi:hypothetical protein TRIUR3_02714 [Triticum urartu]|uniref:Uncharacterized protein n=1 Tax=Triticum urartu TaxID=4572 RepID=M8B2B8_TRIUA|nr:hypothetical protein TRIUR3_02714 [Triticum urartu]